MGKSGFGLSAALAVAANVILLGVFLPDPLLASDPRNAQPHKSFVRGLVFAFVGNECPNGSARLEDSIYQTAGSISGVTYCTFRAMRFLYPEACPSGFRLTGTKEHDGKKLNDCTAEIDR